MWLLGSPRAPECGRNLIIFLYVETCDKFPHRWYFPLACLWDLGASEYKLYSLASGDHGDDASDEKKKNHHIFKDSCFIWSCNSPEQCLTYSAPPCGPEHGIKRQAPLCCPGHWGSIAPPHCPWCWCEHPSVLVLQLRRFSREPKTTHFSRTLSRGMIDDLIEYLFSDTCYEVGKIWSSWQGKVKPHKFSSTCCFHFEEWATISEKHLWKSAWHLPGS